MLEYKSAYSFGRKQNLKYYSNYQNIENIKKLPFQTKIKRLQSSNS